MHIATLKVYIYIHLKSVTVVWVTFFSSFTMLHIKNRSKTVWWEGIIRKKIVILFSNYSVITKGKVCC